MCSVIEIIKILLTGCLVTFGVKNIGQVQKYRFFEAKNIGLNRMYIE